MRTLAVLFVTLLVASTYHSVYQIPSGIDSNIHFANSAEDPFGKNDPNFVRALRNLEASKQYDQTAHEALLTLSDLANNKGHAPAQMWAGNLCEGKAKNPRASWEEKQMWYERALSYWSAAAQNQYPEAVSKLKSLLANNSGQSNSNSSREHLVEESAPRNSPVVSSREFVKFV